MCCITQTHLKQLVIRKGEYLKFSQCMYSAMHTIQYTQYIYYTQYTYLYLLHCLSYSSLLFINNIPNNNTDAVYEAKTQGDGEYNNGTFEESEKQHRRCEKNDLLILTF